MKYLLDNMIYIIHEYAQIHVLKKMTNIKSETLSEHHSL